MSRMLSLSRNPLARLAAQIFRPAAAVLTSLPHKRHARPLATTGVRPFSSTPHASSGDARYPAIAAGHGPWTFAVAPAQCHPAVRPLATQYPSHLHVQVQWGDQDAFGHLNNVSLMRYFESVRMQYLIDFSRHLPEDRRHSFAHPDPSSGFPGPIVASVSTRYKAQVHYPDTLSYFLRVSEKDVVELQAILDGSAKGPKDRVVLEYAAFSHRQGIVVADGACTLVVFDYGKQRKTPITPEIARAVVTWEKEGRVASQRTFDKAEYVRVD